MVDRLDMDKATVSNYSGQAEFSVPAETTDGINDGKGETVWHNDNFTEYWGYFNNVGDLKSALLMKSIWAVGKGWVADTRTTAILDNINGSGKESFDDILFNMDLIKNVNGDSYAEIIRNDSGNLVNLKPLDPSKMTIVYSDKGIIKRYEQKSKIKGSKPLKFEPNTIFHLSNNRLADQIHGISDIEGLKQTIDADQESFKDVQKMAHFQAKPFLIWKLKTDDQTTISAFIAKVENARKLGEDLFIPDDQDVAEFEVVEIKAASFILDWRNDIKNKFYRVVGMPEVLFGTSGATESGGKMEVFAHETVFAYNQRYIEIQLWSQLAIRLKLKAPSSLLDNLQTDENKDAGIQTQAAQPSDVTAGTT
jgi:hypothetical protein